MNLRNEYPHAAGRPYFAWLRMLSAPNGFWVHSCSSRACVKRGDLPVSVAWLERR